MLQPEFTNLDTVEVKEPESVAARARPAAPGLPSSPDNSNYNGKLSEVRSLRPRKSVRSKSPGAWSNPLAFAEAVEAQKKTANLRNQHHFPETAKWYIIPPHVRVDVALSLPSSTAD